MMISIGMVGGGEGKEEQREKEGGEGKEVRKTVEHGVVRKREWRIWKGEWLTGESGMDNREWGKLQGGNGELEIREWGISFLLVTYSVC